MTSAHVGRDASEGDQRQRSQGEHEETEKSGLGGEVKKATSFWTKLSEDWSMNFAGMLAYNYLTAVAPILLALLAIAGLVLRNISPEAYQSFVQGLSTSLPGSIGSELVKGALAALQRDAGVLLVIAIVTAVFTGSRLFVTLDMLFAVVYRVNNRPLIRQNIMALLMMLLFIVLSPLAFFASSLPGTILRLFIPGGVEKVGAVLTIEGFIGGAIVAFILFGAIYYITPNRKVSWASVWPGALAAALLMNLFECLFPVYQSLFLKNAGYGSVVGLLIVILIFLYYVGFITLLGAEVNAWVVGLRPLGATLPQLFRQQRLQGVGNAPGAPTSGVSRTPPPHGAGGGEAPRRPDGAQPDAARSGGEPRPGQSPAQAFVATRNAPAHASARLLATSGDASDSDTLGRFARPFAAITTVGAMLGAGALLAARRLNQPPQPSY